MVYSTKNLSIQDRAVHMKEKNESFLIFFPERERERGSYGGRGGGKGLGLPIPIGPHKRTGAVERFHIAETKDSTSVRDRSMSRRLVPAASKSTYALCSGSLIRKIALGWGSTM